MNQILTIAQIAVTALMVASILLQQRGAGVGGVFGGGGEVYGVKRGAEKVLFIVTIVLVAIFCLLGIARIFLSA